MLQEPIHTNRSTVERIIQMMRTSFTDSKLTLQTFARNALYSPFHFERMFRSITGIPPRQYLSAVRLEQAKQYLMETTLPIMVHLLGYSHKKPTST